ncbi:MAG: cobalamin biosynthesis protein [Eubacterium sp.]|nr:cobalamin biosynthesis protein [Eubacterium sp.]
MAKILEQEVVLKVRLYTKCSACSNENPYPCLKYVREAVSGWAGEQMRAKNALLFIGACGIAVRAIAPFLTDKLQDVPVLVMDEGGRYVIPVLSGHVGGANGLAGQIAAKTGAQPVITTATDIRHRFAVDLFARRNGLFILNQEGIVRVSSKVLAGEEITISIEPLQGIKMGQSRIASVGGTAFAGSKTACLPAGVRLVPYPPDGFADVVVTSANQAFAASVLLKPQEYAVGIGCKRGKSASEISGFIAKKLAALGISVTQVFALASISQKAEEQGIVAWCQTHRIPFWTYTARQLQEEEGDFTESAFVRAQVGVGNVCERAALRACGEGGTLIAPKDTKNGMAIAVAKREWKVCFEE